MEKSQMMMLVVVMAICCFSCISSSALAAGVSGSADFLSTQNQEGDLQSAGETIGEMAKKMCQGCQVANWEGNVTNSDIPCTEIKQSCIDDGLLA